jgi:hypothetical protein
MNSETNVHINGEMVESVKWWRRRNGGHFSNIRVVEMVDILARLESEKLWTFSKGGGGEMVDILATLESEKWWTF